MYSKAYKVASGHSAETIPANTVPNPSRRKLMDRLPVKRNSTKDSSGLLISVRKTNTEVSSTAVSV